MTISPLKLPPPAISYEKKITPRSLFFKKKEVDLIELFKNMMLNMKEKNLANDRAEYNKRYGIRK